MRKITLLILAALLLPAGAMATEFVHDEHLTYLEGGEQPVCASCHTPDAVQIVPQAKQCLSCHDQSFVDEVEFSGTATHGPTWVLNHAPQARLGAIDCSSCHQSSDCMECHQAGFADEFGEFGNNMSNVHRSDFLVSHPIIARTDPQLCSSCHEPKFCSSCHDDFRSAGIDTTFDSHSSGWQDLNLAHNRNNVGACESCHDANGDGRFSFFGKHEWRDRHAREARKNLATCQACHPQGDICLTCHSEKSGLGINPHPGDWGDMDGRLESASGGKTCRKCH